MLHAGYRDEAMAWRQWLLRAVAGDPADVQIMYGDRRRAAPRRARARLAAGIRGSRPVRVGNAASAQLQLDVYGEVIDALYQTRVHGAPADDNIWSLTRKLLDWLEDGWRREDAGIWEVRGPNRHFTHSKVMAWVAFDRAVRAPRGVRARGPGRALARAPRRDQGRGARRAPGTRRSRRSRSPTARTSSTRASC